ncbi:purine-nucleoside phosphorylase [Actinoalloteichus sp. AHMU CJ021]|uniref:Uridine phosphorylase n=1 Tax=Actinoalloteichus caeruleus DSM 43889 TaxID=1120930 RepID=A0ABT1JFE2_ACTCY|nr:nucleoside phosphorylase [Actinoalloteichus caeruleus]AUS81033.1 purine-nucleoside phosphorylase [Actinoalloteichus sp. AHMU CJ021]MCP2330506.1 uridine phosphorylase [Actinoalloteichus caeruleus DSM 43889]
MTVILPITKIPREGLPTRALVVGDPARADAVAAQLDDAQLLGENREYRSYRGRWRGTDLVVSSHGVGGPGALCLFTELAAAGVRTYLRLGTAGSLTDTVGDGDLVVAEAAVRDDGVTPQLVPAEYPSFATPEAVLALTAAAREHRLRHHRGLVWTRAAFSPGVLELPVRQYQAARVIAIEMELSTLLVFAALRGFTAGGALVIDGNASQDNADPTRYSPHRAVVTEAVRASVAVALDALVSLDVEEDRA